MTIEEVIKARLAADALLTALVGTRIRPVNLAQGEARPYLAYAIGEDDDPSPSHDGPSVHVRNEFDLLIVSDTYADAVALSAHAKRVLQHYTPQTYGSVPGGRVVVYTRFSTQSDVEQNPEPGAERPAFMRMQTYRTMHRPA